MLFFLLICVYNTEKTDYENEYKATDDISQNLMVSDYSSNDFMFNFYSENNENLITNNDIIGNCAFVSLAQLLSFYDTIFNDDYVDDSLLNKGNVDANDLIIESPGSKSHKDLANKLYNEQKSQQYGFFHRYIFDILNDNYSLFNLLLRSAIEASASTSNNEEFSDYFAEENNDLLGWGITDVDLILNNEIEQLNDSYVSFGLTPLEAEIILYSYFNRYILNPYIDVKLENFSDEEQIFSIQLIKELINKGIPVNVYFYRPSNLMAHSIIAYGLDNDDNIIAHWGYNEQSKINLSYEIENRNIKIYSALYIDITLLPNEHLCSANFIKNNNYVCACSLSSHDHIFSSYRAVDDTFHSAICNQCHKEIKSKHIYTSSLLKAKCKYCGFLSNDKFTPIIWKISNRYNCQ